MHHEQTPTAYIEQRKKKRPPSLPFFHEQMAAFYCRTHQEQEAHRKVDRNFLWGVPAGVQGGISCRPSQLPPQLEYHTPAVALQGQQ